MTENLQANGSADLGKNVPQHFNDSWNMKTITAIRRTSLWLLAVVLMARLTACGGDPGTSKSARADYASAMTPGEIQAYGLKDVQRASGLSTVPVGAPAYLELLVNNAVPAADITNVSFALSSKPIGSAAALGDSPLGPNVPTYKIADRINNSGAPVFKGGGTDAASSGYEGAVHGECDDSNSDHRQHESDAEHYCREIHGG
jgi:hypothetical protein